jgi:hypothetical protein
MTMTMDDDAINSALSVIQLQGVLYIQICHWELQLKRAGQAEISFHYFIRQHLEMHFCVRRSFLLQLRQKLEGARSFTSTGFSICFL